MIVPERYAKWIGLPYRDKGRGPDAYDCWGGARAVLQSEFGLVLPDYLDAYTSSNDGDSVASAVASGLRDGWTAVQIPREGDLLILRIAARPWHCGVMVNERMFLHWPPVSTKGVQQLSCVERLDSFQWARRIDGVYRYRNQAA